MLIINQVTFVWGPYQRVLPFGHIHIAMERKRSAAIRRWLVNQYFHPFFTQMIDDQSQIIPMICPIVDG